MKGRRTLRLGFLGAAALVAVGIFVASQVWAATGTASVGSETVAPGEQGSVSLEALDVGAPGLGAWTIDIVYDPAVVAAVGCSTTQSSSVCNAEFGEDTVRLTGATASGLEGDTVLGSITFECGDAEGSSPLHLSLFTFADATVGGPLDIDATTVDGVFACEEPEEAATPALPSTGMGDSSGSGGGLSWYIGALAVAGFAGIAGFGALRLRARRS